MPGEFPFAAEPVAPAHAGALRKAFAAAGKRAWCYYLPFLYCYSLPPGRVVFFAEEAGAHLLLVRRNTPDGPQADLLIPPVPFSADVLDAVLAGLLRANAGRPARVLWVDEDDAHRLPEDRFSVRLKDTEYVYDPARVAAAEGRAYRDLRKRLSRFCRETRARFRTMETADVAACHQLLRHWRRRQGRKHGFLLDWGYTRAALDRYGQWGYEDLQGWCVEVSGRIAAFGMGGQMQPDMANFFVAKSDPDIRGLSEYLRWNVYQNLRDYRFVNDAGDLGLPGLRQHKEKFRPVARIPVYTVEQRAEEAL